MTLQDYKIEHTLSIIQSRGWSVHQWREQWPSRDWPSHWVASIGPGPRWTGGWFWGQGTGASAQAALAAAASAAEKFIARAPAPAVEIAEGERDL